MGSALSGGARGGGSTSGAGRQCQRSKDGDLDDGIAIDGTGSDHHRGIAGAASLRAVVLWNSLHSAAVKTARHGSPKPYLDAIVHTQGAKVGRLRMLQAVRSHTPRLS